jgi:dTDP-4-amino-4,6-dideoxygalactose transaminase
VVALADPRPKAKKQVLEVLRSGEWWYGEKVRQFEREFAHFQGHTA